MAISPGHLRSPLQLLKAPACRYVFIRAQSQSLTLPLAPLADAVKWLLKAALDAKLAPKGQ